MTRSKEPFANPTRCRDPDDPGVFQRELNLKIRPYPG